MTQSNSQQSQTTDQDNVQRKLEELEAEVYQTTKEPTNDEMESESGISEQIADGMKTIRIWFDNLPQAGKIVVGVAGILMGFSVLNFLLHMIKNLISIAILGLILYGLYKYLFSNSQTQ